MPAGVVTPYCWTFASRAGGRQNTRPAPRTCPCRPWPQARSRPLIVSCRSGNRFRQAVELLVARGTQAVDVIGGMRDWAGAGLPVVDSGGRNGTVARVLTARPGGRGCGRSGARCDRGRRQRSGRPALVHLLGFGPVGATTASLVIVTLTSVTALVTHARDGNMRRRTGLLFAAAGIGPAMPGGALAARIPAAVLTAAFARRGSGRPAHAVLPADRGGAAPTRPGRGGRRRAGRGHRCPRCRRRLPRRTGAGGCARHADAPRRGHQPAGPHRQLADRADDPGGTVEGWTGRSSGRSSGPRSPAPGTGRLSAKVSGPILQRIFAPVAGRGRVHADRRGRVRRPPRVITPGTGTTSPGGRASAGRPRRSCGRTRCRSCTAACRSR